MADHDPVSGNDERPSLLKEIPPAGTRPAVSRERRVESRLGIDTSVVLRLIDLASDIPGRIIDLSLGGCHIRTDRRFPVGIFRRVEIEFRMEGLPFRLGGVTQGLYDPVNVGVRFLDLSDRKREQLRELIAEMKPPEKAAD